MKKNLLSVLLPYAKNNLLKTLFLGMAFLLYGEVFGQVSYLGLDGGLEGSATIDNVGVTGPAAGKWTKNNATQTIANETGTVRSGANSLRINNTDATNARRVWSPNISVSSTISNVTLQYYRRVASTTNSQSNQQGIINNTEGLSGSYTTCASANTWEKVTYTKASSTWTTIAGVIMHKKIGTGGDMFIDDMCIYTGAVDITAANAPGTVTVNNPSTSSLDVSWVAASGGVDGGGYTVVRYAVNPNTNDDPNANGIYATGNTFTVTNTGTVRYVGTLTSFTDNVGLSAGTTYYYKVYTYDKAYNYSGESSGNGITSSGGTPSVNLSINTSTGSEASSSYFTLTATASSAVTGAQTVDMALTGTGLTNGDFRQDADGPGPGAPAVITFPYTLTIANGQTTASVQLVVIDDATYECSETATFTISNPSAGVTIGSTASQNFTITDNDFPTTDLSINTTTGTETGTTSITLTATASANVIGAQTFSITLSGTNVTNSDFSVSFPQTITIANGATTGTVTFTVADDVLYEGPGTETATFTMAVTSACAANGTTLTQNLVITDNEVAVSSQSVIQAVAGSEANTISSLINGTITSNSNGVQVWRFRLYDGDGTTNDADGLPTIYKNWTIQADGVNNTVPDWSTAIASRAFFLNSNTTPIAGGGLTNPANIPFPVSSPYITVADNGFADIYMRITLANPLPANSDGKKFAFKLTQADVTVETSASSSQLATFSTTSDATKNVIDIIATLQFINAPTTVGLGDAFTVTVSAVDANGNIDQNNTSLITLAQNTGTGTMTGGGSANLVAGTYTWTGLTYDTEETFQVIASGGSFSAITANINVVDADYQLFDHFNRADNFAVGTPSSETSATYTEAGTGDGSRQRIVSNQLLLSNCNSDGSTSSNGFEQVVFDMSSRYATTFSNANGTLNWKFNMRCTRSNPSGFPAGTGNTYASAVILGCDESNYSSATADGYAVIIGNTGTPDPVKLVRFAGGIGVLNTDVNVTNVVASTIGETNFLSVNVSFNPCTNLWSLWVRNDGGSFADPTTGSMGTAVTATNSTHTSLNLKYGGFAFQHGSSCSEILTIDNVNIPNATAAAANTKTWNGGTTDWNTAANWSPCPGIPAITDNVIIPVTANNPIISATPSGLCKDLTVNANAQLTINSGQFLNAHGTIVNNGNVSFGAGTLQLENTPPATVTVTGAINLGSLYNSNNATLNGTVTVTNQARSETGGTLNANGNLVMEDGSILLHGTGTTLGGGTVSGNIIYKRQGQSSSTAYNMWSTPVNASVSIPGGNKWAFNSAAGTHDYHDDGGPNYVPPTYTSTQDPGWVSASTMSNGKGYASQGGGLATFTGNPNNGDIPVTLTRSGHSYTSGDWDQPGSDFNLVGNPYPGPIAVNGASGFLNLNSSKIDAVYLYTNAGSSQTQADYSIFNSTGFVGGNSNANPNNQIGACQGFFVRCISAGTIQFTNAMRNSGTNTFFKAEEEEPYMNRIWLDLYNDTKFNEILIAFKDDATEQADNYYDAPKIRGTSPIVFSAIQEEGEFSIVAFPTLTAERIVPLNVFLVEAGDYTIKNKATENMESIPVYLEDRQLGIFTDISNLGEYTTYINSGESADRFFLHFAPTITSTGNTLTEPALVAYTSGNELYVQFSNFTENSGTLVLRDVAGRELFSKANVNTQNGITGINTEVIAEGVYFVTLYTATNKYTKKIVIR